MATARPRAEMARYAVLGATSWGVTLAWLLEQAGHQVVLVTRTAGEASRVEAIRGLERLPEVRLGSPVSATAAPWSGGSLAGAIAAVPAQSLAETLFAARLPRETPILSAAKGIELQSARRMSEVIAAAGWDPGRIAALSGPNLAHEVARSLPAAAVVASSASASAELWQRALAGASFRVYTSDDVVGVELAGAMKNVVAIAAGAAWGLGFGANTVASIMTRGLAEITRLGVGSGASPLTFQGLAGVGDLAATCFSPLSRNRRFGELLARGESPAAARAAIGEAVEGAATAEVALALASRVGVELPIATEVAAVVRGQATIDKAMRALLSRPLKGEAASGG